MDYWPNKESLERYSDEFQFSKLGLLKIHLN